MYGYLKKIDVTEKCLYRLDCSSDMTLKLATDSQLPIWQLRGNLKVKLIMLSNFFNTVSTQLPIFGPYIDFRHFE